MDNKFVVNIGRQLGSGGREIGEKLAARLCISFYDKELITLASEESGLCSEFFERADERPAKNLMGGWFGMRFPFITDGAIPATNCLSNDALFKVQSDVIRHIFISSTREDRIARLRHIHGIGEEEAENMMAKADKKRSEYYNYYSYKTWGAAASYHLCVDSSVLGIDGTVDFVEEFVRKKLSL